MEEIEETIEEIIRNTSNPVLYNRLDAVYKLISLGRTEKQAINQLIVLLGDSNKATSGIASSGLAKIGEPAIEPLIDALNNPNDHVRYMAATALEKIGLIAKPATSALIEALSNQEGLVQLKAANALSKIGTPAIEQLMELLGSSDVKVKFLAVKALGDMKTQAEPALSLLIQTLPDSELGTRYAIIQAIGNIGIKNDVIINTFLKALPDVDIEEKLIIAEALIKLNASVDLALEIIITGMESNKGKPLATFILSKLGKLASPALNQLITALATSDAKVQLYAARALGNIGDKKAIPSLKKLLDADVLIDTDVEKAAREAIEKIKNQQGNKLGEAKQADFYHQQQQWRR